MEENREIFKSMLQDVISNDFASFKEKYENIVNTRLKERLKDEIKKIEQNLFSGEETQWISYY